MRLTAVFLCQALLSGCYQENNPRNLSMGNVTHGEQLIDLKKSLNAEAIDEEEFETMKDNLVNAASMCDAVEDGDEVSWIS